ncbi:MAG TPA: hypothetical protein PLF27_12005 [Sedimentibacter sp.]|jgi:uncharacterized protein (TIGR04540 family)|nr:hypothetical protein [Methanofastidiosum sp.]HRC82096.1 hypothetical protein [Sedimentibacter sp.]
MNKKTVTLKMLAQEIKAASDDYIAMKLSEKEFEEILFHYSFRYGDKIFSYYGSLKPTIQSHLGYQRCSLVESVLNKLNRPLNSI